RRETQV
nr:Chain B, C-terminal HPV-18 E6 peptide [synthetic construct]